MIPVPLHRHQVSLDFTRYELDLRYQLRPRRELWLRIPYEVKEQTTAVAFDTPVTAAQRDAILRNARVHHRSETYEGLSDLNLLHAWRRVDPDRPGRVFTLALGLTLPAGRTQQDPLRAGRLGLQHLHIQFGTGTVDPLLEAHLQVPLRRRLSLSAYLQGRFPVYENDKGFRGSRDLSYGLGIRQELAPGWKLRVGYLGTYQSFASWHGVRDPNTGLRAHSLLLGISRDLSETVSLGLTWRRPFSQEPLDAQGDAFEQADTFLFRISRKL